MLHGMLCGLAGGKKLSKTFSRRIIWRDLAYWQLHHWPHMPVKPIRQHYEGQVRVSPPPVDIQCWSGCAVDIFWTALTSLCEKLVQVLIQSKCQLHPAARVTLLEGFIYAVILP